MTTYNTRNAIGSTDPRDLYDNAENFDECVNSTALTFDDRFGNARKTIAGAVAAIGYDLTLGNYGAGKVFTERNQMVLYSGEYYKVKASVALPFTTTGTWGTDSASLVGVGDAVLRQDLLEDDGASRIGFKQVGTGAVSSDVETKLREFVSVKDFGAVGDGVTDDTAAIQAALNTNPSALFLPEGIYKSDTINITGIGSLTLFGSGKGKSTIDFSGTSGAYGIHARETSGMGGIRNLVLRDITLTDSSSVSSLDSLVYIRGGTTGATPSETSAFITLDRVSVDRFKTINGSCIRLSNLSHVTLNSVSMPYASDCKVGLLIDNDEDINTGVFCINDCYITAGETAMVVRSNINLLDSYTFRGNFFGNRGANLNTPKDVIIFDSNGGSIGAIDFCGNHIEAGGGATYAPVRFKGTAIYGGSFRANHLSAVAGVSPYAFVFDDVQILGVEFSGNEVQSFLNGASGAVFRFLNTCVLSAKSPIQIGTQYRAITTPRLISVESGGNYDNIINCIDVSPKLFNRLNAFSANNEVISFSAPAGEGLLYVSVNNLPTHTGLVHYRAEAAGAGITNIGGGANFSTSTGVLIGTTGTNGNLTVSAHTDGKIYIENRAGFAVNCYVTHLSSMTFGE